MAEMNKHTGKCLALAAAALFGLAESGCVSAEQHHQTLADMQRLRMEAWQRGVEAAALRMALDRAMSENAQLRAYGGQIPNPALTSLASRVEELSRKQDAMANALRSAPQCAPGGSGAQPAAGTQQTAPRERQVTDILYGRF